MMIDFGYLFNKYNIQANGVLHLGASAGQEAETYDSFGIKKVIWVEAILSVFVELVKNISKYPGHIPLHACVSDVDGKEVIFHVSNNEAQSSSFLELGVHKEIHPTVHYIEDIPMVTDKVSTLLRKFGISLDGYDFLNIDLQGAELLALKGMGDLLYGFKYCYLEVNKKSTYVGCPLIEDLDAYLSFYGFERVETGTWVADCWTDALFIRKDLINE